MSEKTLIKRYVLLGICITTLLACGSGRTVATIQPSATPAPPTPAARPTATPEPLTGTRLFDTRAAVGLPAGEWNVSTLLPGEVAIVFPMTAGISNAQTVRQGQRQIAAIVVALFEADAGLSRVNVVGTLPLGDNEAPAISVALARDEYAAWSGAADEMPGMQISLRLK